MSSSLSSRRAVLLHALDTVDSLVDVCGDFLSSKVAEDLWPLLKVSGFRAAADGTVSLVSVHSRGVWVWFVYQVLR